MILPVISGQLNRGLEKMKIRGFTRRDIR